MDSWLKGNVVLCRVEFYLMVNAPSRGPIESGVGDANFKTRPSEENMPRFRFFETDCELAMKKYWRFRRHKCDDLL